MTSERFNAILEKRLSRTREILASKATEYARDTDRLHNFKRAGELLHVSPEQALIGMQVKHLVSILDMLDDLVVNIERPYSLWDEKITDAINYFILLEALLREREYAEKDTTIKTQRILNDGANPTLCAGGTFQDHRATIEKGTSHLCKSEEGRAFFPAPDNYDKTTPVSPEQYPSYGCPEQYPSCGCPDCQDREAEARFPSKESER